MFWLRFDESHIDLESVVSITYGNDSVDRDGYKNGPVAYLWGRRLLDPTEEELAYERNLQGCQPGLSLVGKVRGPEAIRLRRYMGDLTEVDLSSHTGSGRSKPWVVDVLSRVPKANESNANCAAC